MNFKVVIISLFMLQGCIIPLRHTERPYINSNTSAKFKLNEDIVNINPNVIIVQIGGLYKSSWAVNNSLTKTRTPKLYLTQFDKMTIFKKSSWGYFFFPFSKYEPKFQYIAILVHPDYEPTVLNHNTLHKNKVFISKKITSEKHLNTYLNLISEFIGEKYFNALKNKANRYYNNSLQGSRFTQP